MKHRSTILLLISLGLFALSGASCPRGPWSGPFAPPVQPVLPPGATLEQVIQTVNANNGRVRSFASNDVSLTVPGAPTLRASVAFCQPQRFRLRAQTAFTGPELDVGSNGELFWFWVRRSQSPAVYYCRHEDFSRSAARRMIPVEPAWLMEAFGTATFDPALAHQGPRPVAGDRLEVRTVRDTPEGPMTKVTIVDAIRGVIVEQHAYDTAGQRIASAVVEQHRRDPLTNLVVPQVVKIDCPRARFSMRVDLGNVRLNRLDCNDPGLWTIPRIPDAPLVDLGAPSPSTPSPSPYMGASTRPPSVYDRRRHRRP